jgi:hypothetical protein
MRQILITIVFAVLALLPVTSHSTRTFKWDEQVLLSDGSTVWLRRVVERQSLCSSSMPGSCQILRSTLEGVVPGIGTVTFHWEGSELPLTLDMVDGRPWVAMPISGLELCDKYGNPQESVVAFSWENGAWTRHADGHQFRKLKLNMARVLPKDNDARVSIEAKYGRGDFHYRGIGSELSSDFIPHHMQWEHSCHRLNPPRTPAYEGSIQDFLEMRWAEVLGKVVEVRGDRVTLSPQEERALFGIPGPRRGIVGCEGKVGYMHSVFSTHKEGTAIKGSLTAYRISLTSESQKPSEIFIPSSAHKKFIHVNRVVCSATSIYLAIPEGPGSIAVLAYDTEGHRKKAWRIRIPELASLERREAVLIEFAERGDHFYMMIGDHRDRYVLGKRYVVDAPKL